MFQNTPVKHNIQFEKTELTLETGLLANQATSSVLATLGETVVLAAVVVGKPTDKDYFPLQVVFEERMYASGKIKGSRFQKREGRPSENAVLTGRMIDRSLRSLFDPNIRNDIQVVITVLSVDEINPPDTLAVLAASAALKLCGLAQFQGPVSSIRVGLSSASLIDQYTDEVLSHIPTLDTFAPIREKLEYICSHIDIANKAEDKELFRTIFDALNEKNSEFAAKLKLIYQSVTHTPEAPSNITKIANPTYVQLQESFIDLVVSGDGNNIMMIEAGAQIVDEYILGECLDFANTKLLELTNFQNDFIEKAQSVKQSSIHELSTISKDKAYEQFWFNFEAEIEAALYRAGAKLERADYVEEVRKSSLEVLDYIIESEEHDFHSLKLQTLSHYPTKQKEVELLFGLISSGTPITDLKKDLSEALDIVVKKIVQKNILYNNRRIDGRDLDQVRVISTQIDVLPRTHGSSLFNRGETQVLNVLTLGTKRDAQTLDDMEDFEEGTKRYIHHYNFPAYSVGETGRYSGPGRREIGHGALAEKALLPVLPSEEEFPYTMRLVSECLGSNGSTSMASTCGSCLSLLAGGVPLKDMVAGVAMGLVLDKEHNSGQFKVLTDIMGAEDHYGDMDFKVTGTKNGITALQLDNKVAGLTTEILKEALIEAKKARLFILSKMQESITMPRPHISIHAPQVMSLTIPVDKIGEVIGPSGKIIKSIIAKTDTDIDIEDNTGVTFIYGKDAQKVQQAFTIIQGIIKEFEVGEVVTGKVFRIEAYGAFIKINNSEKEGMIHISQLAPTRINKVEDVVNMNQEVTAKIIEINEKGQLSLSLKI